MKYGYIILGAIFCCIIGSCSKSKTPLTPDYGSDHGAFTYTTAGFHDTALERSGNVSLVIEVRKTSGPAEDVKFAVENVPQNVSVSFEPESAKPPFNAIVNIKANKAAVGTHDFIITTSSKTTGKKAHNVRLTIKPFTNISREFDGQYTEADNCTKSGLGNYNVLIQPDLNVPARINIKGFRSGVWSNIIYADLTASSNTLVIPKQRQNGLEYTGTGTINGNMLTVSYAVTDTIGGSLVNESCTASFTAQ